MKRIITLLAVALTANLSISQVVFQSDLSSWGSGVPTDFFGTKTNLDSANCTEVMTGAMHGSSFANLINTGGGHKRFTTKDVTVTSGQSYVVKMWVAATAGDIRVATVDTTSGSYGYNSYKTLSGTVPVVLTDTIAVSATSTSVQFIFSFRNSSALGIALDSVSISVLAGPPPPPPSYSARTIYEIQYTSSASGDSPFEDSLVETTGIVTGTHSSGYFIQDSALAWNGIYVYDNVNTPNRGDKVTVKGKVKEFFDLTEIADIDTLITVSTGNAEPTPVAVNTSSIASERYEGVLVKVSAVICVDSNAGRGEWDVANASMDTLPVDDLLFAYVPVQFQGYDVTGVVQYNFNEFKLEPRDSTDIVQSLIVTIPENGSNLEFNAYPNPVQNMFTLTGANLETAEIYTTTGQLVRTVRLNTINTIDVSDLTKGVYILKVRSGNKVGTSRFVKL